MSELTSKETKRILENTKKLDKLLKENYYGFGTHYTEKIIKIIESKFPLIDKEFTNDQLEEKRFWMSFDFHMINTPGFEKKARDTIRRILSDVNVGEGVA